MELFTRYIDAYLSPGAILMNCKPSVMEASSHAVKPDL